MAIVAALAVCVAVLISVMGGGGGGGGSPASPSSGGGGSSSGTLSPNKQQKLADDAIGVCDSIQTTGTVSELDFAELLNRVETDIGWSQADAIKWFKQVASKQCPEYLGNLSRLEKAEN